MSKVGKIDEQEKLRLEQELENKIRSQFGSETELVELIKYTLKNLSYRYIESQSSGEGEVKATDYGFAVEVNETDKMEFLKIKNSVAKPKLIQFAKDNALNKEASVQLRIWTKMINSSNYHFEVGASILDNNQDIATLSKELCYDDPVEMRNNFAREIDEVCELFV
ncbi:MAG: hypothetical protein GY909_18920 [Oligoflexia bacterium]|nr:hypothetical protein [Oligoflexia bacterium]